MVETQVGVGISTPAVGSHDLDTQNRDAVWQDALLVVSGLVVEGVEVWQGHDTRWQASSGKLLGGVDSKGDLGTGGGQDQSGVLDVGQDVTTSGGLFNGGAFQLWDALSGQGNH